jgi:hypothetical protein
LTLLLSSIVTIVIKYKGNQFDPIREIQKLKNENRRDDALDLAWFFQDINADDNQKIIELEKEMEYTTSQKLKSFAYNGAIKGEVYDTYSGAGAIAADLCVIGDVRDFGIQSYKYLNDEKGFDGLVMILSTSGLCLSATPYLDGVNALAKNSIKYLKRIPTNLNRGILQKLLTGKISPPVCKKIWTLLKKTNSQSHEPYPAYQISAASNNLIPPSISSLNTKEVATHSSSWGVTVGLP